jgi:hypothetical protein
MARIRSIHPALFTDEAFAGLSMAARVLLLGLWTEADDQGVFDWKPITIKMRIMPVDNVDVPSLLIELEDADVIRGFVQDSKSFGAIRNFCKFQRPKTPKYRTLKSAEIRNYVASAYPVTETTEPEPEPFPQKVEMPPQMEEGGGKEGGKEKATRAASPSNEDFENFKRDYPKRAGQYGWKAAERKYLALVKTGVNPKMIALALVRFSEEMRKLKRIGTEFIPMPASWLNSEDFVEYAASAFDPKPIDWDALVKGYQAFGTWPTRDVGNDPSSPSCRAPTEILRKYGLELRRMDA